MNSPTQAPGSRIVRVILALIAAAVLLYLLAPNFRASEGPENPAADPTAD